MEKLFQTIIVGAGPGGLIAGHHLEDALILEQKKEIGKPVQCGEGISKRALEIQKIKLDFSWISCPIHKIERIMPNGKAIGKWHKEFIGYVIDREKFEKSLAKKVKCEIKLNSKVIDLKFKEKFWHVLTEGGELFKATYLIGADGANSIVRRKIFKQNLEIFPAIEYLTKLENEIESDVSRIYLDSEKYPQGYAWIFPKSKNTANIGVIGKGDLIKNFNEFLEKVVKKNYGVYKLLENKSGVVSINGAFSKILKDNVMLVGDAAGLADPLFKGGMSQAMSSAKIAAECILKNEVKFYELKIKSMPFANPKLIEAGKIFYTLDNQTLNELGEILEEKGSRYLKTLPGIVKVLSKSHIRKNIFKLYNFFTIWWKSQDYLW